MRNLSLAATAFVATVLFATAGIGQTATGPGSNDRAGNPPSGSHLEPQGGNSGIQNTGKSH